MGMPYFFYSIYAWPSRRRASEVDFQAISPKPWAKCPLKKPVPSFTEGRGELEVAISPIPRASWLLLCTPCGDLKILILMNLGELGKKEVTRLLYRMPVAMQDIGGSSSSFNHVESGRGININEGPRRPNPRASSHSPNYVNRPERAPHHEVPPFEDHAGASMMHSLERDDVQFGGLTVTTGKTRSLFRKYSHLLLNQS
ncbi:hypothetical protein PIB30_040186 [Stylosanthes scabra]|uniref:Uncharacterized protein n=1 Tax=Stylosanthes scabra TaxID=79078 RepID=A0ABU6ZD68_9FABA|nr:hypothetical protein [Stylosanthes scabra]